MKIRAVAIVIALVPILVILMSGPALAGKAYPQISASTTTCVLINDTTDGWNDYSASIGFTGRPAYWSYEYLRGSDSSTWMGGDPIRLTAAEKKAGQSGGAVFGVAVPDWCSSVLFKIYDQKGKELGSYNMSP